MTTSEQIVTCRTSKPSLMMDWSQKKVLVTGAGGFIGSHLSERLATLGANTRALVRYSSTGSLGWLEESQVKDDIEMVLGDVRDADCVREAATGMDVIFHLAALVGIPYSYHAPSSYVQTNIEGTLNMLQAAVAAGVQSLVQTSTSEVYGTAQYVPIDEEHPVTGQSPYSATKIGADKLAEAFNLSHGLPVAIIRPFNTYGPRQSSRAIIPTIVTQALTGGVIRLGNLAPTRDFNYVADTVEGFISVAACPEAIGKVTNIGSGKEVSIGDLANTILNIMGKTASIAPDDERVRPDSSEVKRLLADNSRAQNMLGWSPQYSLESGLTQTIEWIQGNLERYRLGVYAI